METYNDRLYCEACGEEYTDEWEEVFPYEDTNRNTCSMHKCPRCGELNINPEIYYVLQYGTNPRIIKLRNRRKE